MGEEAKKDGRKRRDELLTYLRKLAKWKNNDAVKLVFLEQEEIDKIDELDLAGLVELKRNANGTLEIKFVDKVRVLAMLRELLDQRDSGALEEFMAAWSGPEDGDEA